MSRKWNTAFLIAVIFSVCFISCKSYKPAFDVENFYTEHDSIEFIDTESYLVLMPKDNTPGVFAEAGIIFYPGARVDYHAYLPFLTLCAEKGTACYIVKMPMNFAFLDSRAAEKFPILHPEIKHWYIAGHSLGGAIAASYLHRHQKNFDGLILLASFSTNDFSTSGIKVLSIYGSKDGVLKMKRYQKNKKNLPPEGNGLTQIIIEGGNHSQFGDYGEQKGDQKPEITSQEQQQRTAEEIIAWAGL